MKAKQTSNAPTPKIIKQYRNMPSLSDTPDPIPEAPQAPKAKIDKAKTVQPKTVQPKAVQPKAVQPDPPAKTPKLTKKAICIEMISRKGGATLDDMAQAIADQGICEDLKTNRTTCSLWVHKIGFKVDFDKDTKTYRRA